MPLTDLPLDALREYRGDVPEPADLDAFWAGSLALARGHDLAVTLSPNPGPALPALLVDDVRFSGWNGDRIAAWLIRPAHVEGPLPVVVEYIGYTGGRGLPVDRTVWAAAGFAHLVVDTRGQGHDTPDPDPEVQGGQWAQGFMTKGIEDPATYYYRRAYVDCARAVDVAHVLPSLGIDVDTSRIVVRGASQGGGFSIATAALSGDRVAAALVDVPFLCHFRRATHLASAGPYPEIVEYLRRHSPENVERAFSTLAYVDGVNLAARATVPTLFSVALMDPVCPPSTVFAAYNHWGTSGAADVQREIDVWEFADHAGGIGFQVQRQLRFLDRLGLR